VDLQKITSVARFELLEAIHSRLVAVLILLYGGGSLIGSRIFLGLWSSAEQTARVGLAEQMKVDPSQLPEDLIRAKAMPWLVGWIEDEATRRQLLEMDPLSIFFGFATLKSVAILVLLICTASIVGDVSTGATRFVLFRCDRLSWVLGKSLGLALLVAFGLGLAVVAAAGAGVWGEGELDGTRLLWLLRTAFRAWIYSIAYLGLFSAVSMVSKTPTRARATALLVWIGLGVLHAVLTSEWIATNLGPAAYLAWLLPAHHQSGLWSGSLGVYTASLGMLMLIAAVSFYGGYRMFERRDA
jgi:hypothetical protein